MTLKEIIAQTPPQLIADATVYTFVINKLLDSDDFSFVKQCIDCAFIDDEVTANIIDSAVLGNNLDNLKSAFLYAHSCGNVKFPIIEGIVNNLVHQVQSTEVVHSDYFALYVPQLKNGIIHYSLVFFPWTAIEEFKTIDHWTHLIPGAYPEDDVSLQDLEGINILQLTESEAQQLLENDTLPSPVEFTYMNFDQIINALVLNAVSSEPLIAMQVVQQLMESLGFDISGDELDDEEEFWINDNENEYVTSVDELYSKVSIYHCFAAQTGEMYYE